MSFGFSDGNAIALHFLDKLGNVQIRPTHIRSLEDDYKGKKIRPTHSRSKKEDHTKCVS